MGYNPPAAPPRRRVLSISEQEIVSLKELYIEERVSLEEFEERVENWLKWETLGPIERRKFETENEIRVSRKIGTTRGLG